MINLKTTIGIVLLVVTTLTVTSCKKNKKTEQNKEHSNKMKNMDHSNRMDYNIDKHLVTKRKERNITINKKRNKKTTAIVDSYLEVKNALVTDSRESATKGANALLIAFSKFDMTKLDAKTHKEYMDIIKSAKENAEHISKSPIKHQREHFVELSTDITDLVKLLGTEKTLYKDFCPMANNGKGAFWLSEIKNIKNPYMGSKSLTCGSMKKQLN